MYIYRVNTYIIYRAYPQPAQARAQYPSRAISVPNRPGVYPNIYWSTQYVHQ